MITMRPSTTKMYRPKSSLVILRHMVVDRSYFNKSVLIAIRVPDINFLLSEQ
jgi:hypothetical protein